MSVDYKGLSIYKTKKERWNLEGTTKRESPTD